MKNINSSNGSCYPPSIWIWCGEKEHFVELIWNFCLWVESARALCMCVVVIVIVCGREVEGGGGVYEYLYEFLVFVSLNTSVFEVPE